MSNKKQEQPERTTSPHTTVKNMTAGQATGFAAIDTAILHG